ncbi:hypothetical protein CC86DRAFT_376315 [Ophiobolus disseminans]|uniref:DUF6604 domain-containing protein n=1 Tax=Ophiobolus disseminans TaxID=1469910 RepID=A0A6A7AK89_9PLEO|nr:hypothetical protein CC86DRAFT_376315 [Ophiobolus disseminans]
MHLPDCVLSDHLQDTDADTDVRVDQPEEKAKITSVTLEKDEAEIEAEFFFAVECFLEEVQSIRTTIKDSWGVYKRTGYDLVIATLLTNTAIELVRQADDQLELLVERPAKYPAANFPV